MPPRPYSPDPNMNDILRRVRDALPALTWTVVEPPPGIAKVSSGETPPTPLGDATTPLGDATTPLGDATTPLGDATNPPGAATGERWRVLLCEFEMVDAEGKPAGVRGVDGTATCLTEPLVIRLPSELANIAARAAGLVSP